MDEITPLAALMRKEYPGQKFNSGVLLQAGKRLTKEGYEAAVEFLKGKGNQPDFKPPAKCSIIAMSRPMTEWPIYKVSEAVQQHIYALTVEERAATEPETNIDSLMAWFAKTGVDTFGYQNVQGLNKVFNYALKTYDGVIVKVENRNEKRRKTADRINEKRRAQGLPEDGDKIPDVECATTEDGHLKQPPGINPSIYCYQAVSPVPFTGQVTLPAEYQGYKLGPDTPIPDGMPDRLTIPKGSPGYVPEKDRLNLTGNKHKRVRAPYSLNKYKPKPGRTSKFDPERLAKARAEHAVLGIIRIGADWVVFDMRGLIRNLRWREIAPKTGLTPRSVLTYFTGDPVLDPIRNIVTFSYKAGVVGVTSTKVTQGPRTKFVLTKLTETQEIGVVSIDLGQTNPVAAGVYRVGQAEGLLQATRLQGLVLPEGSELLQGLKSYRRAHDALEAELRQQARSTLSPEQQEEIRAWETTSSERTKAAIAALGVPLNAIPWDAMTASTSYISDYLIANGGDTTHVWFEAQPKKPKKNAKPPKNPKAPQTKKSYDRRWVTLFRPKLSEETRKAVNEAERAIKNKHAGYKKLATRKKELTRQIVNYLLHQGRTLTQCKTIALVIEDLNVPMFHGSGKRARGWEAFFTAKNENRWFIQALHKALSETAVQKGIHVLEVNPARTSMTCPRCKHCDAANRSDQNRERFVCVKCGATLHADLEVATDNILCVALTGKPMPKAEQSGDAKTPRSTRKRKAAKTKGNQEVNLANAAE